jgi:hypothetical protein
MMAMLRFPQQVLEHPCKPIVVAHSSDIHINHSSLSGYACDSQF